MLMKRPGIQTKKYGRAEGCIRDDAAYDAKICEYKRANMRWQEPFFGGIKLGIRAHEYTALRYYGGAETDRPSRMFTREVGHLRTERACG